jgi:hypothetical protein
VGGGTNSFMRLKARSTVLLPQPEADDGSDFCFSTGKFTFFTARKLP